VAAEKGTKAVQVRARARQLHRRQREPGAVGLHFDQPTLDRIHRHAVHFGVKGREQRGYLDLRPLPQNLGGPADNFELWFLHTETIN